MFKKTYSIPSTVEHGSATGVTLGVGEVSSEGGSLYGVV
jgi:hypothetical protein